MKNKHTIIGEIVIWIFLMFIIIVVSIYFTPKNSPEQILSAKHSDNSSYELLKKTSNEEYTIFLGKDNNNFYLDIVADGKYFGGSEDSIESVENITTYQFQQYKTLLIVYGENPEREYTGYELHIKGDTKEPKNFTADISKEDYVLDVYKVEKEYNYYADLTLKK